MSVFNIFDKAKWARKCEPRPVWAFIFPHDKDCGHLSATHIFFIRQLNTAFGALYMAHGIGKIHPRKRINALSLTNKLWFD